MRPSSARLTVLLLLALAACSKQGFDKLEPPGDLVISRVACESERVYPGQRLITVQVRCENFDPYPIDLGELRLRFSSGESDRSADFIVQTPELPAELPAGRGATFAFSVEVRANAATGPVQLDASGSATRFDGSLTEASQAREGDSFEVVEIPGWLVTTSADEDDMGDTPSVEAAGGALDLSLREAIRIANASGQASVIRFDPTVFPESSPASILLDPALGSFEPLTQAGMVIDGGGAGVVINGAHMIGLAPMRIQADDIHLQSLTLTSFDANAEVAALEVENSNRLHLVDMRFVANGLVDESNTQVRLRGGSGHLVSRCIFEGGGRDGLALDDNPSSAIIIDNQFISNNDEGLSLSGNHHEISRCNFVNNGGCGAAAYDQLTFSSFVDCSFVGNGFEQDYTGLLLRGQISSIRIQHCLFENNDSSDVQVSGPGASSVFIRANVFSGDQRAPILLHDSGNEQFSAPNITGKTGDMLQGTAPAGASVEVYQAGVWLTPTAETVAVDGHWSVALPAGAERLTALATSVSGSTSAFSEVFQNTPLVVTTVEDELDGGEDIVSVEQAGGSGDLSFREALTIAANGYGADTITFDPTVFPAGQETVIQLRQGPDLPDELPLIRHPLILDGRGTGEVIDGGGLSFPANSGILRLENAAGSQVLDVAMRSFDSRDGACIYNKGSNNLRVSGCELSSCGEAGSGAAIRSSDYAYDGIFESNIIRNGYRGVHLVRASGSAVRDNSFDRVRGAAIYCDNADELTIADNRIRDGSGTAIVLGYSSDRCLVLGNSVVNNAGRGLFVDRSSSRNDIWFNSLLQNSWAIELDDESSDSSLINNLMAYQSEGGLKVQAGATWRGEHNLYFDNGGDGDTGANAVSGGSPDGSCLLADPGLPGLAADDLTPVGAAVDAGVDIGVDRNGSAPGLFNGAAPDIGAVEAP